MLCDHRGTRSGTFVGGASSAVPKSHPPSHRRTVHFHEKLFYLSQNYVNEKAQKGSLKKRQLEPYYNLLIIHDFNVSFKYGAFDHIEFNTLSLFQIVMYSPLEHDYYA